MGELSAASKVAIMQLVWDLPELGGPQKDGLDDAIHQPGAEIRLLALRPGRDCQSLHRKAHSPGADLKKQQMHSGLRGCQYASFLVTGA